MSLFGHFLNLHLVYILNTARIWVKHNQCWVIYVQSVIVTQKKVLSSHCDKAELSHARTVHETP